MALASDYLKDLLITAFPKAKIELQDLRGDQDYYQLKVICTSFAGKSRIQQHQMVYAALQGCMGKDLHALSIQTATPPNPEA